MQISRYTVCSTSYRPSRVECVLATDSIGYTQLSKKICKYVDGSSLWILHLFTWKTTLFEED